MNERDRKRKRDRENEIYRERGIRMFIHRLIEIRECTPMHVCLRIIIITFKNVESNNRTMCFLLVSVSPSLLCYTII